MLFHVSENRDHEMLRMESATCRHCHETCLIGLVRETRVVRVMVLFSGTTIGYRLVCSKCRGIFALPRTQIEELGGSMPELMRLAGPRLYPAMLRILFGFWPLLFWPPLIGLLVAWRISDYRIYFGERSRTWWRRLLVLTVLANLGWAALIAYAVLAH